MQSLEKILSEHLFLKDLQQDHLELIVGCAANHRFNAGEFLFREGEEAQQVYLVRRGHVAVEIYVPHRGAINLQTVGSGEFLGWSWLIPPHYWHFDALALDLVRVISLDAQCLRKKCEEDHSFGYQLIKCFAHVMEQRLHAARLQLLDVYGVPSEKGGQ